MTSRPDLPIKHENPHLQALESDKLPPVKYQMLDRDGHEVLVGRVKIPTPGGHAFILRRFDTGAISLTTMFRAAFPTANECDEKKEIAWVKETYDLSGNNGSPKEPSIIRLAGTWLSPDLALLPDFAETYNLAQVIPHMIKAIPDPQTSYRRSTKANGTPKGQNPTSPVQQLPTPTHSVIVPTPKRRRESSPALEPVQTPRQKTPTSMPPPRRSARTKSPAPMPLPMEIKSPRSAKKILRREVGTPGGSDETIVEEAETIEMARPNMSQDIAEQKELIEALKAEREAARKKAEEETMSNETDMEMDDIKAASAGKRPLGDVEEEEKLRFEFKEPETQERQIATNKRVGFRMGPKKKSFAWGVAAFAVGLGAVSFLPNFF